MKALILVGGYGTRLRPLTLSIPKPLVEFCNYPILIHQIKALIEVNICKIILAVNRQANGLEDDIRKMVHDLVKTDKEIELIFSYEDLPMGTGGPLKIAEKLLKEDNEPFFVLNSDIISNYPFQGMIDHHKAHNLEGTMAITKVDEPCKYGAVKTNSETKIVESFVEKPIDYLSNTINAGLYIFNPSILKRITSVKPTSMEFEIFPQMVSNTQLSSHEFKGFWMDIGQPKDYLLGMRRYLGYLYETKSTIMTKASNVKGNVIIHETANVHPDALIGPNVTIGKGVLVKAGVRLSNCAIFANAVIKEHAWIADSIIGWRCNVGRWARLENTTVLGENVEISDEIFLNGALVLPHNHITQSQTEPTILM